MIKRESGEGPAVRTVYAVHNAPFRDLLLLHAGDNPIIREGASTFLTDAREVGTGQCCTTFDLWV